jgi:hypothetical protein
VSFSEKISTRIKVRPEFTKAMDSARTIKKAVPYQQADQSVGAGTVPFPTAPPRSSTR